LEPLPRESLGRLRRITQRRGAVGSPAERQAFSEWLAREIGPRNIAGLADPQRRNLYPVDFDALIEGHALLGMSRDRLVRALPALRGMSPQPSFTQRSSPLGSGLAAAMPESASYIREPDNHT
jgi:hypothetical protein